MTIAEKLYISDKDTLLKIIVKYQLAGLARLYFPDIVASHAEIDADNTEREYARLMQPSNYSGRTERRKGAVTQAHRSVLK